MRDFTVIYAQRQLSLAQSSYCAQDREAITAFLTHLQAVGVGERRLTKYAGHFLQLAKMLAKGRPLCLLTGSEIDVLLKAVNTRQSWSGWTRHDYQLVLKKFFAFHDGNAERAGRIKIITPALLPSDENKVLTEQEISKMLAACRNVRDKAALKFLYLTGARLMEFLTLKVGSVEDRPPFLLFKLEGTKNKYACRTVPVDDAEAISLFHEFMTSHPFKHDANAPLWLNVEGNAPLEPKNLNELLRYRARVAGVKKKHNPHAFRHARVTHLRGARKVGDASLELFFGWTKGSAMLRVYDKTGFSGLLADFEKTRGLTAQGAAHSIAQAAVATLRKHPKLAEEFVKAMEEDGTIGLFRALPPSEEEQSAPETTYAPWPGFEPGSAT